jgi:anthraniloyl-CoA monooxygenase
MKIVCLGGGPAGLYFALLMKKRNPAHEVTVVERNRPYDTFGWGVVFSDQTLGRLQQADPETAGEILQAFNHWDDIEVNIRGARVRSSGHGFCGIGRKRLLNILQARCEALGVQLRFEAEARDEDFPEADLIIASDGLNSRIRQKYAATYQPDIDLRQCRFVWLGTRRMFEAFTFDFQETPHGWFQAHAYRFDGETSTFIVETPEQVWQAAGLAEMEKDASIAWCERLFANVLQGHRLMSNADHLRGSSQWIRFPRVVCRRWVHHNGHAPVVLMGDAAHTAHFSIGSGTKLALEDAIELAQRIGEHPGDLPGALRVYEDTRSVEVLRIQNAARNSTEWFENVQRYAHLPPQQFAYTLLTRSQRISHENLRQRDRGYLEGFERWWEWQAQSQAKDQHHAHTQALGGDQIQAAPADLPAASHCGATPRPTPPMFTPYRLRGCTLANRVVVSPMAQYMARDGVVGDWHLMHLGARAVGGAGLVMAEMTCTSPQARITPGCPGLWNDEQAQAWARIVDFVHRHSTAKIGVQLGHAGPKGSTNEPWEGAGMDTPLAADHPLGNWPLLAASAQAYVAGVNAVPQAMTRADMDQVLLDFEAATTRAAAVGFDWLELHCAHGYLLSSFISPLTNHRQDAYGGPLSQRLAYPLEVFRAVRRVWPQDRPISVRISAHDWVEGGITPDDAVEIGRAFKSAGADMIDCSSGQVSADQKPVYGRLYQTPFADRIRNEAGIPTIAVGAITDADQVNGIIAAGRADLCAVARPHLAHPAWTLQEAARWGHEAVPWPLPYTAGKQQMERLFERERAQAQAVAPAREMGA